MYEGHLRSVYREYVGWWGVRSAYIEETLARAAGSEAAADVRRLEERAREPDFDRWLYRELFTDDGRAFLETLIRGAMDAMRGRPLAECGDALEALVFLCEVAATGLWKHRLQVGRRLEWLAREFDRLDVPSEQARLHALAQRPWDDERGGGANG